MEYVIRRNNDELMHYGIPGMKWGVRRYQNKDGTLTKAGLKRQKVSDMSKADLKEAKRIANDYYALSAMDNPYHPIHIDKDD